MDDLDKFTDFVAGITNRCDRCKRQPAVMMTTTEPIELTCDPCMTDRERREMRDILKRKKRDW